MRTLKQKLSTTLLAVCGTAALLFLANCVMRGAEEEDIASDEQAATGGTGGSTPADTMKAWEAGYPYQAHSGPVGCNGLATHNTDCAWWTVGRVVDNDGTGYRCNCL